MGGIYATSGQRASEDSLSGLSLVTARCPRMCRGGFRSFVCVCRSIFPNEHRHGDFLAYSSTSPPPHAPVRGDGNVHLRERATESLQVLLR